MTRQSLEDRQEGQINACGAVCETPGIRVAPSSGVVLRSIDPPIDNPTRGGFEANDDAESSGARSWFVTLQLGITAVFGYLALCAFGVMD